MSIPTIIKLPRECGGKYAIKRRSPITDVPVFDFSTVYMANDWFLYNGDSYCVLSNNEVKEFENTNHKRPLKTVGRDKIRKKPLFGKCYYAETVRPIQENGEPSMYVYCRGYDGSRTCQECEAYMPLEEWERGIYE